MLTLPRAYLEQNTDGTTPFKTTVVVYVYINVKKEILRHINSIFILRSIDDLSPEYGGLPFVKKLKILNERQKLEELELVMKTRSFSLDIPDSTQQSLETDNLTRSQSEGSHMHQDKTQQNKNLLTAQLGPSPLNSSSESNETLERKNLKSILKKLSEDTGVAPTNMPEKRDSTEFRKLMRAPTIEG